jgi:hypothetical protein
VRIAIIASMFAKSSSSVILNADAGKDAHQTTIKISHFQQSRIALRHQRNLTLIPLRNFAERWNTRPI